MQSKLLLVSLLAAGMAFAQNGEGYTYEERAQIGLYAEYQQISNLNIVYKVMGQPYTVTMEHSPAFGGTGYLPITNWFGLRAVAMFQKLDFKYQINDTAYGSAVIASDSTQLTTDDFDGNLTALDVIAQGTAELGIPLYSNYDAQTYFKLYGFGGIVSGKNFLDDSRFQNGTLWGLSTGAGAMFSFGWLTLNAGYRYSGQYWHLFFDPAEKTGTEKGDDEFMLDYRTMGPFLSATMSLY